MRIALIPILIIFFKFQSILYADNIQDFEIEGISIGDSLLKHMTLNEIKSELNRENKIYYNNKSYVNILTSEKIYKNLQTYDDLYLVVKTKDTKYEIVALEGLLIIKNKNITTCYKKQMNISNEIIKSFPNLNLNKDEWDVEVSNLNKKVKSIKYIDMNLPLNKTTGGQFRVSCHERVNGDVHLYVIINSKEFVDILRP